MHSLTSVLTILTIYPSQLSKYKINIYISSVIHQQYIILKFILNIYNLLLNLLLELLYKMEFTVITIRVLVSNIHVMLFVVLYLYSVNIQVRLSGHTPQLSQNFGVRLCLPATDRFEKFVERGGGGGRRGGERARNVRV